ncbi:DUF4233 domain-containing protein [Corynebacterium heidelbergense]|uniref:DUF4233 domain-containing protein n=1 Tax=Corynebacterium heidelbergense TaxID=2055947 RepID=A0A364V8R2_9CORY|nr:DUF4233 domain-containing protein [Corynebacterium heidelbergense]RAV33019.1 DUF4233 domain-containing protein [Corynebacterium heidelbergense]
MAQRARRDDRGGESEIEYGPLGPGHAPENDPLKGLRGVMAGTLIMEAIVVLLVLTVITRIDGGAAGTPGKIGYVVALGVAMVVAAFLQKRPWADKLNMALQVLTIAGVFVHVSMAVMGILFAAVWWYIYHLRKVLLERMRRGLLPAQHIGPSAR